jgi:hypothetical protein
MTPNEFIANIRTLSALPQKDVEALCALVEDLSPVVMAQTLAQLTDCNRRLEENMKEEAALTEQANALVGRARHEFAPKVRALREKATQEPLPSIDL